MSSHFPLWANSEKYDVIIIGSGLAGLNAARQCQALGLSYLVLEASDRIGGRIKSLTNVAGLPELGGMQIGKGYGLTRHLINQFNLPLAPPTQFARGQAMSINGKLLDAKAWAEHDINPLTAPLNKLHPAALLSHYLKKSPVFEAVDWLADNQMKLDISLEKHLLSLGASKDELALIENSFNGISLKHHSALDALKGLNARKNLGRGFDMVVGGNQQLPEAIAASLTRPVQLQQVVTVISGNKDNYQVSCSSGEQFKAKQLIITAPFAALKHIDLSISLSEEKRYAINQLSYTPITQAIFKVNSAFWLNDNLPAGLWSDTLIERIFALKNKAGNVSTLMCWINGTNALALDRLTRVEQHKLLVQQLAKVRPSTKGNVELLHVESWANNPYQGGAYAHYQAGTVHKIAPYVAESEAGVHFAGEHTQPLLPGIEAALVSGMQAADNVTQLL